jgi:hypothetical protein
MPVMKERKSDIPIMLFALHHQPKSSKAKKKILKNKYFMFNQGKKDVEEDIDFQSNERLCWRVTHACICIWD